jgi:hypothetical protein
MESPDNTNEPVPNVGLGFALAVGLSATMWVLIYLGVASIRPRQANSPDIAVEGQLAPQLAGLTDAPRVILPIRTKVNATQKRRRGRRQAKSDLTGAPTSALRATSSRRRASSFVG